MRFLNKVILFFGLLFSPYLLSGQYHPSQNYSTKEGLPNNAVRSLFLDSKNVLWIGTENGVSRMENGSFSNLDETDGLGHNSCWDINQDSNGNMWFASYGGGVSKYDGKKFKIFNVKNGLPIDRVRKLFPFKNKLFIGTELGISIVDINTNKVVTPKGIRPHFGVFLVSYFFTYKETVYFSTVNEGLFKVDYASSIPKIVPVFEYKITGSDNDSHAYSLGNFGSKLYLSNKGFVNVFDLAKLKENSLPISTFGKSVVWDYAKDKRSSIYAAAWGIFTTDGGLFEIANDKMIDVSEYYGIDSKILLNVVYDKLKDILYVGSNDKGIYEVRLNKMIDYNLFDEKSIIDFEVFNNKKVILHPKGISFLNTENTVLSSISLSDFKKAEIDFIKKTKKPLPTHADDFFELNYDLPASGIEFYSLVKHDKVVWVSSNIGLFEINIEGKIINYVPIHTYEFGFTPTNNFFETNPYGGVHVYDDIYNLKVKSFTENVTSIVKILNHNDKTYLLSVFNGLYVYKNNKFHSYLAERIWDEKKFKHITFNNKGQLILASEFGNVFLVEDSKSFKILKTITKKEIVGNTILFLESYKDFILIGTEKGINLYKDGVFSLIDKEQGLKDAAVTTSQVFDNQLWLGTKKGYYTIDLDHLIAPKMTVSEMEISSIAINNIPINSANYEWFRFKSKELICDYKDNSFSIDFIPKGHAFPNKLKFRYRLNNTNRWSPYSEKTNLFLPYLPYGTYNLEVEVFDSNAGKATIFNLLKIHIKTPFWMTWWFVALVILVVFNVLVYLIFKSKRKSREKAVIQKRIAETKLEALLSQMNPHFTFNAINAIQDYIISNDIDNSLKYTGEFSKLIRKTLENSSKQTITIDEEIEYLRSYITIENMRYDNRIESNFHIGIDVDIYYSKIPTMLLQPFVENVFVHAFNASFPFPKLTISFEMLSKNSLECKIIDNGMSLTATKKMKFHQSKGIQLTKERLSLLQNLNVNPIDIQFTENNGTTVTIRLTV
jgi:hypothetical protein